MKRLFSSLAIVAVLCLSAVASFAWPTYTGTSTLTYATDNNTSSAVTLPRGCNNNVGVYLPTLESTTVAVHVSNDGTTYAAYSYNAGAAAAPAAWVSGAITGAVFYELPRGVTAFKYLRFELGTGQTANRVFTVTCN